MWGQLDDRKDRALRVLDHREAPDIGNVHWWHYRLRAKRRGLLETRVAIINREIDSPVRRNRSHVRSNLHHAAGVLSTVHPLGVLHRITVRVCVPAKKFGVEIDGPRRVGGYELVPGHSIRLALYAVAGVFARLPDAESSSSRIDNHRHPARIKDIEGLFHHCAA